MQQSSLTPSPMAFYGHWFNDEGQNTKAQEAGYEHLKDRDGKP
jgi:hypothetical protein